MSVDALPDANSRSDDPLSAVLTLMRLSRALDRVDAGLVPGPTGDGARVTAGLGLLSSSLEELRHARGGTGGGPVSPGPAVGAGAAAARAGRA